MDHQSRTSPAPATRSSPSALLDRLGIPSSLSWGFLGLLLFMIGDGVESGYLAPYLGDRGLSPTAAAWVFSAYGLAVALAGFLSGVLSEIWGPRRVIMLGLGSWLAFELAFLAVGLPSGKLWLILLTYGLRGIGYPLFAFGFLVWITVVAPHARLGSAMGWFWFAFTGGLPTLGSVVASFCVPRIGAYRTLWLSAGLVLLGGIVMLAGVRDARGAGRLIPLDERPLYALLRSVTLAWKRPKTGIACIVRIINTAPEFGFFVLLPAFFTGTIGFTLSAWLHLLSAIFLSNIIWNLLFGLIGDRLGWRQTVAFFGGFGSTLATLALFYVPVLHRSYTGSLIAGIFYGCTLAGYVPLSALMPSLAPDHRGASLSLLNLGAGASVWVGPMLVAMLLRPIGVVGLVWTFALLYLVSGFLALTLRLPEETTIVQEVV